MTLPTCRRRPSQFPNNGFGRERDGGRNRLGQADTWIEARHVHGDDDETAGQSAESPAEWQRVLDTETVRRGGAGPRQHVDAGATNPSGNRWFGAYGVDHDG